MPFDADARGGMSLGRRRGNFSFRNGRIPSDPSRRKNSRAFERLGRRDYAMRIYATPRRIRKGPEASAAAMQTRIAPRETGAVGD